MQNILQLLDLKLKRETDLLQDLYHKSDREEQIHETVAYPNYEKDHQDQLMVIAKIQLLEEIILEIKHVLR